MVSGCIFRLFCFSADEEGEEEGDLNSEVIDYESPEQLDQQLVTLSLLPDSRWKNLLHLDIIKVSMSLVVVCGENRVTDWVSNPGGPQNVTVLLL